VERVVAGHDGPVVLSSGKAVCQSSYKAKLLPYGSQRQGGILLQGAQPKEPQAAFGVLV
jgi:hypothetical protein